MSEKSDIDFDDSASGWFIFRDDTPGKTGVKGKEMHVLLLQLSRWVPMLGMLAMFWGMFEMAKAMKDDDAAGKHKGLAILVAGVALWQIIRFMKWILGWS